MKLLHTLKHATLLSFLLLVLPCAQSQAAQTEGSYKSVSRYNLASQLTGSISPNPGGDNNASYIATRNTYDIYGRLTKTESGYLSAWQDDTVAPANWTGFTINHQTEFQYNSRHQKISELTSSGTGLSSEKSLTQYSYNTHNLVECRAVRMNPAIYDTLFQLRISNACELQTEGESGPDRITRYTYDARWDKVSTEKRAVGVVGLEQYYARYSYTNAGEVFSVKDANNNLYQGETDEFGRLNKWKYPEKGAISNDFSGSSAASSSDYESFELDGNGNRTRIRKRNGNVISQTFDALNQLVKKDAPGSTLDVVYDYDNRGLQTSARFFTLNNQNNIVPGQGITTEFDGFGQITSSTNNTTGTARTISHEYDANGNRKKVIHPDNKYFSYHYDKLNRLTDILENSVTVDTNNRLVNQTWDDYGRAKDTTFGNNGVVTSLTYDGLGRVNAYGHDFTDNNHNFNIIFGYNSASQVTLRDFNNATYVNTANDTLTGDYQVNGLNQYRCHGSAQSNCAGGQWLHYDDNGNLTNFNSLDYQFDNENRLTSRTQNGIRATYHYDPMGRLVKAQQGNNSIEFLYDGDALIAEYQNNVMTARYVHGSRVDNPLVSYSGSAIGSNHRHYLHSDHQGSIIAHSDNTGNRVKYNTYDEYGIPGSTDLGRFAYTGQIVLPYSNTSEADTLYHYKARVYYPTIGRFMQTDPVGYQDQINLYSYVANDPLSKIHPSGKFLKELVARVVGGTVIVVLDAISSGGNMSAQQVAGSFTGGFVTGALISNGVSLPAANAIGAVAGETVTQLGNVAAGGEFSGGKILTSGVAGAIAGKVPELRVPGITSGRGSMSAAFKGQLTKIGNGTTKNPTMKTIKNGVGAGVIGGVGQQAAKVGVNNGVGDSTANAIDEQMGKCLPANPHC